MTPALKKHLYDTLNKISDIHAVLGGGKPRWQPLKVIVVCCIIVASCQSESVQVGSNSNGGGQWRRTMAALVSRLYVLRRRWHDRIDISYETGF